MKNNWLWKILFAIFAFAALFLLSMFILSRVRASTKIDPSVHRDFPQQIKWETDLKDNVIAPILVSNDYAFVVTEKKFISIEVLTGNILWELPINPSKNYSVPPKLFDNFVTFQNSANGVSIISIADKKVIWECNGTCNGIDYDSGIFVLDYLVTGTALYVARYNESITAIDLLSNQILWSHGISSRSDASISLHNGILYLVNDTRVNGYDPITGSLIHSYHSVESIALSTLDAQRGEIILLLPLSDPAVVSINLDNMEQVWSISEKEFKTRGISLINISSLKIIENSLFISSNKLMNFDLINKQVVWVASGYRGIFQDPIKIDQSIFCRTTNGYVFDIDFKSGIETGYLQHLSTEHIGAKNTYRSISGFDSLLLIPLGDSRIWEVSQ